VHHRPRAHRRPGYECGVAGAVSEHEVAGIDTRQLVEMSLTLREMLDVIHRGFVSLDLDCARSVLQMDQRDR